MMYANWGNDPEVSRLLRWEPHNIVEETRDLLAEETPMGRLGQPADVAETIYFLASPAAAFLTGQVLAPNGGFVI